LSEPHEKEDSELKRELEDLLGKDNREKLKELDRAGRGESDRLDCKYLLALAARTILFPGTAYKTDSDGTWFTAQDLQSTITGWQLQPGFLHTVKAHMMLMEKRRWVLHEQVPNTQKKHPNPNDPKNLVDVYSITTEGRNQNHNNIGPLSKGITPVLTPLVSLVARQIDREHRENEVGKIADRPQTESLEFSTDEERKLAYDFLKHLAYKKPFPNRYPQEIDASMTFYPLGEAEDALKKNYDSVLVAPFLSRLRRTQLLHKCTEDPPRNAICLHLVETLASELLRGGSPMDKEEWSFKLLNPQLFLAEERRELEQLSKVMANDQERRAGFEILRHVRVHTGQMTAYSAKSGTQVNVMRSLFRRHDFFGFVKMQIHAEGLKPFLGKLSNLKLAHYVGTFLIEAEEPKELAVYYVSTQLLRRILMELWNFGSYYRLVLDSEWRMIATSSVPDELS
jgi:hypothetical protein